MAVNQAGVISSSILADIVEAWREHPPDATLNLRRIWGYYLTGKSCHRQCTRLPLPVRKNLVSFSSTVMWTAQLYCVDSEIHFVGCLTVTEKLGFQVILDAPEV